MGKQFWVEWQLWEKMCFVLASSIVGVLLIACGRLVYNRWRLRKYTAIAAAKAAHQPEMQGVEDTIRRKGPNIPFGVRAIESGVEVDGVWISRPNTPNSSSPGSPASTASRLLRPSPLQKTHSPDRTSSGSTISRLDMSQSMHTYPAVNVARVGPSPGHLEAPSERTMPAEKSHLRPLGATSEFTRVPRGRPTYRPRHSSHLRFSNSNDYDDDNGATAAAPGEHEPNPDRKISNGSSNGTKLSESWSGSTANGEAPDRPMQSQSDSAFESPYGGTYPDAANKETFTTSRADDLDRAGSQALPQICLRGASDEWTGAEHPVEQKYYFADPSSLLRENEDPFVSPIDSSEKHRFEGEVFRFRYSGAEDEEMGLAQHGSRQVQTLDFNQTVDEASTIPTVNAAFDVRQRDTSNQQPHSTKDVKLEQESDSPKHPPAKRQQRESRFIEGT